jgi:flagellar protein FliS
MLSQRQKLKDTYGKVGIETGVIDAEPYKLILMLIDGAIFTISTAAHSLAQGETAEKGMAISKAIRIISEGLQASLDVQAGGEIAVRLNALYDYMCRRLLEANLRNDPAALDEVNRLLNELKAGWEEIAADPAVVSRNKVQPA